MTISEKSQLGLRFISDNTLKVRALNLCIGHVDKRMERLNEEIKVVEKLPEENEYEIPNDLSTGHVRMLDFGPIDRMFCTKEGFTKDIKYFLVRDNVFKAAELIKIGINFTGRTLKDIKHGDYVYLLGKHKMVKFVVVDDGIKGIYFDDHNNSFFEWGVKMESGEFFHYNGFNKEFSQIMQLLTFIELGDIEVSVINGLQKIKGETKDQDTFNGTKNTVYIVDSSWNKLLIRTDGFAVRGHFRLQPCGSGMKDRTLIWIDAFEKHGYTRKPRAKIIHDV